MIEGASGLRGVSRGAFHIYREGGWLSSWLIEVWHRDGIVHKL